MDSIDWANIFKNNFDTNNHKIDCYNIFLSETEKKMSQREKHKILQSRIEEEKVKIQIALKKISEQKKYEKELLNENEKKLSDKEKQKILEIRIEEEKIKNKNLLEAVDKQKRYEERQRLKRKFIEEEEVKACIKKSLYEVELLNSYNDYIESINEEYPELCDEIKGI
jgi:uncharacterized protein YhaN